MLGRWLVRLLSSGYTKRNSMERAFRIYHYCIFYMLNRSHLFFNYLNPVFWIFKLPYFKRKHNKTGFNPVKTQDDLWMNKENGLNVYGADGVLGLTLTFFLFSLFLVVFKGHDIDNIFLPVFFVFGIISIFFALRFGSANDNYLKYTKEFELWSRRKRMKYLLLSILFTLSIVILFFAGMSFNLSAETFANL